MSSIGLNANTFQVTGNYIRLLNEFLADFKSESPNHDFHQQEIVVDFLRQLNDFKSKDPKIQMASNIVERCLMKSKGVPFKPFVRSLIFDLETPNVKGVVEKLEFVVSALDSERHRALLLIKRE
jgi:hypothetical protein